MTLVSLLMAFVFVSTGQTVAGSSDDAHRLVVEDVVASTTREWRAAFDARGAVYDPPRVLFLRPPPGHPARGAGYSRSVGLIVDMGDVDAVLAAFPQDGPSLVALMTAHEVGHHVQAILGDDPEVIGAARERQADCLGGWWIVQADRRARATGAALAWPLVDLKTRLPEILRLLDVMQSGNADGGLPNLDTHGAIEARVVAYEAGMAAATPWVCLWGLNP